MGHTTPLALVALQDIPDGGGKRIQKDGLDLAVFRRGEQVYAINDSCPHAGASLSTGRLEGLMVACRAHGLKFNISTGHSATGPGLATPCHTVYVADGMVYLQPKNASTP